MPNNSFTGAPRQKVTPRREVYLLLALICFVLGPQNLLTDGDLHKEETWANTEADTWWPTTRWTLIPRWTSTSTLSMSTLTSTLDRYQNVHRLGWKQKYLVLKTYQAKSIRREERIRATQNRTAQNGFTCGIEGGQVPNISASIPRFLVCGNNYDPTQGPDNKVAPFIIGGGESEEHRWPWMAALFIDDAW